MGIQGLLPFVKKACRHASVKEFKGGTVAIDASCWLHKGGFGCADKLATGEQTNFYVQYCLKYTKVLLSFGVHVILVFDGAHLPAKKDTAKARKERRESMKEKGHQLLMEGKTTEASNCFKQSVQITSEMVLAVIQACRDLPGVDCLVAPYESDVQLAFLQRTGIADLILTEDSDLILFGCDKILFKFDTTGQGMLFEKENLPACLGLSADKFNFEKFRRICILSGCDYLQSLPGIGLMKAAKFFSKTNNTDLKRILPKVPSYLNMSDLKVDPAYITSFIEAENTFLYQIVFDPMERKLRPLNDYPEGYSSEDFPYAGKLFDDQLAYQIAIGNVQPTTRKRQDNFVPVLKPCKNGPASKSISIWQPRFLEMKVMKADMKIEQKDPMASTAFGMSKGKTIQYDDNEPKVAVKRKATNDSLLLQYSFADVKRMGQQITSQLNESFTRSGYNFFNNVDEDLEEAQSPQCSTPRRLSRNPFAVSSKSLKAMRTPPNKIEDEKDESFTSPSLLAEETNANEESYAVIHETPYNKGDSDSRINSLDVTPNNYKNEADDAESNEEEESAITGIKSKKRSRRLFLDQPDKNDEEISVTASASFSFVESLEEDRVTSSYFTPTIAVESHDCIDLTEDEEEKETAENMKPRRKEVSLSKHFQTGCKPPGLFSKKSASTKTKAVGAKLNLQTSSKQSDGQYRISDFLMKSCTSGKVTSTTGGSRRIPLSPKKPIQID